MNPPEHARLRGRVINSFSSKEILPLREMALTVAHDLVDALRGQRSCDLAQAFAFPLPVALFAGCWRCRLAQAEMEVALQVLLTRLPAVRPVPAGIRHNYRANQRGVSALRVEW